jgi:hypothetical protein
MKKLIASILLSVASLGVYAQAVTVNTANLTTEQAQQLAAIQATQTTSTAVQVSTEIRKEMGEWGAVGQGIGVALISAAKELGVAANEFATTPLGKIATGIIVYKMIGEDVLGGFFGTFVLLVGFYWGIRLLRGSAKYTYEIKQTPVLWGLWTRNVRVISGEIRTSGDDITMAILGGVMLAVSCIIFFIAVF